VRQEILTSVERRWHWSTDDKQRIVMGPEAEGISLAELARHDVVRRAFQLAPRARLLVRGLWKVKSIASMIFVLPLDLIMTNLSGL
jgi:hypothetical protein